jgi:Arc/MetJ family transcription regulator
MDEPPAPLRLTPPRARGAPPPLSRARPDGPLCLAAVIFKRVGDHRPYPDHGLSPRDWAALPPRQVRLDELVTTKDTLHLGALLDEDSTFFGDLFAHVVDWRGDLYLEDGLHRALRAALQQRQVLHARVHTVEG